MSALPATTCGFSTLVVARPPPAAASGLHWCSFWRSGTSRAAVLPEDVFALLDHDLLDLGGTYGDPNAGDPIQYDELRIEHEEGDVEIVVYNRAILLFTTDSEPVRRIHEVCCRLDDIATRPRRATSTRRSIWLRSVPARRQ